MTLGARRRQRSTAADRFTPPIVQALARFDPFFYAIDAARSLIDGAIFDVSVLAAFAVFAVLSVVSLAVFIRGMREAVA